MPSSVYRDKLKCRLGSQAANQTINYDHHRGGTVSAWISAGCTGCLESSSLAREAKSLSDDCQWDQRLGDNERSLA